MSKYTIRVHTSIADSNYFKMSRLSPDRNNVRPDFLESTDHQSDLQNQSDQSLPGPPTPHYNATLLMELGAMERHLKELYDVTQQCPAVVDAVMLSKIWLKQRGLENVCILKDEKDMGEGRQKKSWVGGGGGGGGGRERERGGEEGREREKAKRECWGKFIIHLSGIWRIHWISLCNDDVMAASFKEDQPTYE